MKDLEVSDIEQEINTEFSFKLVMLGDSGVGKTSLVKHEINNAFNGERDSTIIFEHSFKNFGIMGKTIRLQIWDTCGNDEFALHTPYLLRNTSISILVLPNPICFTNTLSFKYP